MAKAYGARITRLAQFARAAALLALGSSLIACATLFFLWHTVDRVPPEAIKELFYLGPDYHLPSLQREALLREIHEQHEIVGCTGLDHLGIGLWPVLILLAGACLAGLASRAKAARANLGVSSASVAMSAILAWLAVVAPMLRHLFETQGPARYAQRVFDWAISAAFFGFVLTAAARVALVLVTRKRAQP